MYTNNSNIPLPFAVWLAADFGYDREFDPVVVSATELLRPMRSIILSRQLAADKAATAKDNIPVRDIAEKAASALGTAVHTAVEVGWTQHYGLALRNLGYPENFIERIQINPETGIEIKSTDLTMYFEKRSAKLLDGFIISGKFDLVLDGFVHDIKTTKAYTYMTGNQDAKYAMQGSIYRWLNPVIITKDIMSVDYFFTDWSPIAQKKEKDKNYPPNRMLTKELPLNSIADTEAFIRAQLKAITHYTDKPQEELPQCTPEELWQNPAKYEYWSKAENSRCSNVCDTYQEAQAILSTKGVGFIKERQFEPTFCKYCDARSVCHQAQAYTAAGLLI